MHGTTDDGKEVTVSFGKGRREGDTGIASGHLGMDDYEAEDEQGIHIGHDHFGPNGEPYGDRSAYRD